MSKGFTSIFVSAAMLAVGFLVSCGTTDGLENVSQESAPVYYERIYSHYYGGDVEVVFLGAADGFEFYRTHFDEDKAKVSLIVVDTSQSFKNNFSHSYREGDIVDSGSITWALTDKALEIFNHWDTFFKTGITHVLSMRRLVETVGADVSPLGKVTLVESVLPLQDIVGTDSEPFEFVCSKVDVYFERRDPIKHYLVKVKDEHTEAYHVAQRYEYNYEVNYNAVKRPSYNFYQNTFSHREGSVDDLSSLCSIGYIDADGFLVEKSITLQELHDKIVDYMKSTENRIFSVEDNARAFEPRVKYFFGWVVVSSIGESWRAGWESRVLLPDGSVLH